MLIVSVLANRTGDSFSCVNTEYPEVNVVGVQRFVQEPRQLIREQPESAIVVDLEIIKVHRPDQYLLRW